MKVRNMTSSKGNPVANQFIVEGAYFHIVGATGPFIAFQSYDSVIVVIDANDKTYLDKRYWDYSVTTGKYRNQFLGETKKETQAKIDSGEYKLVNLN